MSVTYFPFTFLNPDTMMSLAACFSNLTAYQISETGPAEEIKTFLKDGFLEIRVPVAGDEEKISAVLRDYNNWADLHQNTPAVFLKQQMEIPFFSETSISKIRTDITNRSRERETDTKTTLKADDRLFAARIFLALAQEYDVNKEFIHKEFHSLEKKEQKLFDELRGEPGEFDFLSTNRFSTGEIDPGRFMAEERIRAWSLLLFSDRKDCGVYVTDSPAVLEFFDDQVTAEKEMFTVKHIPVRLKEDAKIKLFKDKMRDFLEQLIISPKPLSSWEVPAAPEKMPDEKGVNLTAFRILGQSPGDYFGRFLPDAGKQTKNEVKNQFSHTLICLVTPDH